MDRMSRRCKIGTWWKRNIGFRGTFLLMLSTIFAAYGTALITATASMASWWPISERLIWGMDLTFWGWIWIAVGTFLLSGVLKYLRRAIHFAVAVGMNMLWLLFTVLWWTSLGLPGGWGLSIIWAGITLGTLIISAWPEPNGFEQIDPPDEPE
jgi:hypothetical protein